MTKEEMRAKAALVVINSFFTASLNMNDVFGWAVAESADLAAYDFEKMIPIIAEYGDTALVAFASVKSDQTPQTPMLKQMPRFHEALAAVKKLKAEEKLFLSPSWYPDTED